VHATVANNGVIQVSTAPKGNAPRPLTFHGARIMREIGIKDDAQKVSNATFPLKDITLVWRHRRCDDVRGGFDPFNTWAGFKSELKKAVLSRGCSIRG